MGETGFSGDPMVLKISHYKTAITDNLFSGVST